MNAKHIGDKQDKGVSLLWLSAQWNPRASQYRWLWTYSSSSNEI